MTRFVSQMLKLPLTAFVYTMEMFVKTMQGLRKIADQGIDVMTGVASQNFGEDIENESDSEIDKRVSRSTESETLDHETHLALDGRSSVTGRIVADDPQTDLKEENKMPDTNLSDEMLKLVRYKILFVKRDYEHAFPEVEELVHDNMTGSSYSGWKIAEFIQGLHDDNSTTLVPKKWKDYPPAKFQHHGKLTGFPEEDKKYLRVFYEVLDRYVREDFRYEEDQIDVLKEIRDEIRDLQRSTAGSSGGGSGMPTSGSGGGGPAGGGRGTAS